MIKYNNITIEHFLSNMNSKLPYGKFFLTRKKLGPGRTV